MIRSILITVLTIGIIGVGYWGYKEHEEKNDLLIHAENTYQRSFHELSYHLDMLHDKIGTSLAMNTGERLSPQFVDIWRITSQALNNVGQLPLSLVPVHDTEEFLSKIGDFTYKTAIRNLDDDPLSEKEIETLQKLYSQSEEIKDSLREMQHTALSDNIRWMDVEQALASEDAADNSIIDGFKTVEESVGEFTQGNNNNSLLSPVSNKKEYDNIKGKKQDEKAIRSFSQKLFSVEDADQFTIEKSGKGADLPTYSVSYEDGKRVYMDITEQGAHPISILVDRDVGSPKISLHDGLEKAEQYIKDFDYKDVIAFQSQQFEQEGVYSFMPEIDGVRIFPDTIMVKVALDNGDITGFNARPYLMNHHSRDIPEPTLSEEEAMEHVNKDVDIEEAHLSLIENDVEEEVLVYEFLSTMDNETFRIFINADSGAEEKVEKLSGTETNFDVTL